MRNEDEVSSYRQGLVTARCDQSRTTGHRMKADTIGLTAQICTNGQPPSVTAGMPVPGALSQRAYKGPMGAYSRLATLPRTDSSDGLSAVNADVALTEAVVGRHRFHACDRRSTVRLRRRNPHVRHCLRAQLQGITDVLFAVGTTITGRPPHRSGRAQLRHPAPGAHIAARGYFGNG
jgi:hypothetical protein